MSAVANMGVRPNAGDAAIFQRRPPRSRGARVGLYLALALLLAFAFFPTFWLVSTSLKPQQEAFQNPPTWVPRQPTLASYQLLPRDRSGFVRYFTNSVIVGVATTVVTLIAATHAGYALSRFRFRGARGLLLLILATQMFPYVTILISLYTLLRRLGLLNTYPALILAFTAFSLPFSIWMMKGFCDTVPGELEDAARVDGATRLQTLYQILFPVILPGIVAVALFTFLTAWNELLFALTLTSGAEMRTIPPGFVLTYIGEFQDRWPDMMAASVVVSLPVVILFTLFQRQLVRGLTAGAIKG
jgi:multiple sugar transport system permease protein